MILTFSNGGRSWMLHNVRTEYPRSQSGNYGDPDAPGAARRQREELVKVLETGWKEYEKRRGGAPCPWDLRVTLLGRLQEVD